MKTALLLAKKALDSGEIPVGAVVVRGGKIIGSGFNRQITDNDPTAHAEIAAMREASINENNFRLDGAKMFVTVKPCLMCSEAIKRARISEVFFISQQAKPASHKVAYKKILEDTEFAEKSEEMIKEFFKKKRCSKKY